MRRVSQVRCKNIQGQARLRAPQNPREFRRRCVGRARCTPSSFRRCWRRTIWRRCLQCRGRRVVCAGLECSFFPPFLWVESSCVVSIARFGRGGQSARECVPAVAEGELILIRYAARLKSCQASNKTHSQKTRTFVLFASLPFTSTVRYSRWSTSSSRFSGLICERVSGTPCLFIASSNC